MKALWLTFILLFLTLPSQSQSASAADPVFEMEYTHPAQTPARWTLTLHPDGTGHFHSERKDPASSSADSEDSRSLDPPQVDREIQLSSRFTKRVFDTARKHKFFNEECDSHLKVAFTGWKKISYRGPDGSGSCKFNFSQDKEIDALGGSLVSVAEGIAAGERLRMLLQHDRLGLDREMENLAVADADGRVGQLCVIRGILERVRDDPRVMERVKKRARTLLAHADEE